ncbi:MAG TPA: glucose-6-phosphate dehydrogenase assembly protein OpcA [Thermoanaerobaculia bacterium]|nr:glucose-6-phosphate dehydrogenase assembly protein OpcA [Thermoanaerobaculia bacterium]
MATPVSDSLESERPVDVAQIERSLAELWRNEQDGDAAVTRAALWNVVAHTSTSEHHAQATEVLSRASAAVPQRSIVINANAAAPPEISSWISANCHLVGGGKQMCSEEIAIVAGGDRIHRVPPLVNALLLPDMPVAVWWMGDLPNEHEEYVETLLDPADRLIVDSSCFDSPQDLELVGRVAAKTTTIPADLNWIRLEEWRAATASVFDPPDMRGRLTAIRRVRVVAGAKEENFFGDAIESLLYASWLTTQAGDGADDAIDYRFERRMSDAVGQIAFVEIVFEDGSSASISRDRERGVLMMNVDGIVSMPDSVTRTIEKQTDALIVRQLKQSSGDRVLVRALPMAAKLAKRLR